MRQQHPSLVTASSPSTIMASLAQADAAHLTFRAASDAGNWITGQVYHDVPPALNDFDAEFHKRYQALKGVPFLSIPTSDENIYSVNQVDFSESFVSGVLLDDHIGLLLLVVKCGTSFFTLVFDLNLEPVARALLDWQAAGQIPLIFRSPSGTEAYVLLPSPNDLDVYIYDVAFEAEQFSVLERMCRITEALDEEPVLRDLLPTDNTLVAVCTPESLSMAMMSFSTLLAPHQQIPCMPIH